MTKVIGSGAKTLCCKNGDHLSRFDQSQNIPESGNWLLIGYIKQQLDASRMVRDPVFPLFYGPLESRVQQP